METQRKPTGYWLGRVLLYLTLTFTALLMIVPFYWTVGTSLKLEKFIFASPPQWLPNPATLMHYIDVLTRIPFPRYFLNSVVVAFAATSAHVVFDTLAAY